MVRDLIQCLEEHARNLATLSCKSASVSVDVVADADGRAMTSHVSYSAVMVIDGVKRYVAGHDSLSAAVAAMVVLHDVEALRSQARYFGYGLVRLPDADDREAGQ